MKIFSFGFIDTNCNRQLIQLYSFTDIAKNSGPPWNMQVCFLSDLICCNGDRDPGGCCCLSLLFLFCCWELNYSKLRSIWQQVWMRLRPTSVVIRMTTLFIQVEEKNSQTFTTSTDTILSFTSRYCDHTDIMRLFSSLNDAHTFYAAPSSDSFFDFLHFTFCSHPLFSFFFSFAFL